MLTHLGNKQDWYMQISLDTGLKYVICISLLTGVSPWAGAATWEQGECVQGTTQANTHQVSQVQQRCVFVLG